MSQSTNPSPSVHLCPHSHTWYARGLLNSIGFVLLLFPMFWQIFLQSAGPSDIFKHPIILKILLSLLFSFILEVVTWSLTKHRTYTDASFLLSTLLLLISLPARLPLETIFTSILFAYLTTKWLFNRRPLLTPFVCTAYAYAFLTNKEFFTASPVAEFSPFISNFLDSHHLNSEAFRWLINTQGQTLNTFTAGYICIGLVFFFLKITSFRISVSSLIVYGILTTWFGKFEDLWKYPQIIFALIIIAGDTSISPFSNPGKWIYGCLIGFFTFLLQILGQADTAGYFAVLAASLFVPIIDNSIRPILLRKVKKTYEVLL